MSITTSLSDPMTPFSDTLSAFTDEGGITNAITYDQGSWRTLFLGWPFEHLAQADGEELIAATLSWLEVPPRPQVDFEPISLEVCEGEPITFTNASSYANAYLWSFGDGVTSTLTNTAHIYSSALTATVALTGSNCCGYAVVTDTIRIYDAPQVEFTASADLVYVYQPVTFTLRSTNTIVLSYTWNFGDGTEESRDVNPTHKFTESGWYTVTLTTQDERCTGVTERNIYVSPLIYLPITLNQPNRNAMQPDLWQGSQNFIFAAISTLALGLVFQHPFKRR
jgi:PKD repeat protein